VLSFNLCSIFRSLTEKGKKRCLEKGRKMRSEEEKKNVNHGISPAKRETSSHAHILAAASTDI
jgi:hypothetical protein